MAIIDFPNFGSIYGESFGQAAFSMRPLDPLRRLVSLSGYTQTVGALGGRWAASIAWPQTLRLNESPEIEALIMSLAEGNRLRLWNLARPRPLGGFAAYVNNLRNSLALLDSNSDGLSDFWTIYNNSPGTEPATASRVLDASTSFYWQRLTWAVNNTTTKGFALAPAGDGFTRNAIDTISFAARASGSNVGRTMTINWNTAPLGMTVLQNPPLSAVLQRYVFQAQWGQSVDSSAYVSIVGATQGTLDVSLPVVERGATLGTTWQQSLLDGVAVVAGAGQTGNSLTVSTNNGNQVGLLNAGDFVNIGGIGSNGQLVQLTAPLSTNGSGVGTMTFKFALRASPPNAAAITLHKPSALFIPAGDLPGFERVGQKFIGQSLDLVEVFA